MSATLSVYELQRLENIRKNKEVLNDLGLRAGLRQANPGDHDDLVVERLQPRHVAHLVPDQLRARLHTCERFFSSLSPSFSSAQCSAGGRTPNMQRKTR